MAATRTLALLVLAVLIPGCSEPLEILGPTPAGEGITIYLHANYAGPSQAVNHDVNDLEEVEGPCTHGGEGEVPTWSDCVSSAASRAWLVGDALPGRRLQGSQRDADRRHAEPDRAAGAVRRELQ